MAPSGRRVGAARPEEDSVLILDSSESCCNSGGSMACAVSTQATGRTGLSDLRWAIRIDRYYTADRHIAYGIIRI